MRRFPEPKTHGERLLADYFERVRGWLPGSEWDYEPALEGRRRRPDFRLRLGGWKCMVEVKEFGPSEPSVEGRRRGRHGRISAKIHAARRQLREYQHDHLCAVALLSGESPETDVDDPAVTLGALVGDARFATEREPDGTRVLHLGSIDAWDEPERDPPVAAVIVVRATPTGAGLTILENPLANRTFPSHLFQGPWDACWAVGDAGFTRVFAGAAIRAAEALAVAEKVAAAAA